jgi:DNA-binding transcriptional ArsR family regulator
VLKALAHPFRRAVLAVLAERDTDATELTIIGAFRFGLASSTASEHLGVLRRAGLATAYYSAPQRVYSLAPRALDGLADWADQLARADPDDWIPYEVEG